MRLGITLSGGGTRCVSQLAIIQTLTEKGIKADEYSGTSGGALVAALLGAGLTPEKIMEVVRKINIFFALRPALAFNGLLDVEKTLYFLIKYLPETFEELSIPLTVGTTNIRTGETEYFSSGPLIPAILASCCVPVIFKPVKINGQFYIDGGLINNLPVEPLKSSCDRVMGIHTNPVDRNFFTKGMKGLLERTFLLTVNTNVEQRIPLCDVFLEPEILKGFKVFDFKRSGEIYAQTKSWMIPLLPQIIRKLS